MRTRLLTCVALCVGALAAAVAQQAAPATAPETFSATAQIASGAAAPIQIHLDRYSPDFDRTRVETALKTGGYLQFVPALRNAPEVGYVELGGQKTLIRWARDVRAEKIRTIVVVTERPVFFIGGGLANPKSRAGYEVAVIQLQVDDSGRGTGTMAAAARVKPGGPTGVQIDDYADERATLANLTRKAN